MTVTTDPSGTVTTPLFAAAVGQIVTATATDASNNTSEFSACVTVPEDTSVTVTGDRRQRRRARCRHRHDRGDAERSDDGRA